MWRHLALPTNQYRETSTTPSCGALNGPQVSRGNSIKMNIKDLLMKSIPKTSMSH